MLRLASAVNSALLSRVALAVGIIFSLYTTAHAATLTPESAQTGTYAYQVTRDGEVVGEQRNDFERRGDELRVVTDVRINITLLGLNVYDFTQRIEESWQNGLVHCQSRRYPGAPRQRAGGSTARGFGQGTP